MILCLFLYKALRPLGLRLGWQNTDRHGLTDWLRTTIKPRTKVQNTDQSTKHGLTDQYLRTDLTKHGWSRTTDYFRDRTITEHGVVTSRRYGYLHFNHESS